MPGEAGKREASADTRRVTANNRLKINFDHLAPTPAVKRDKPVARV
jgi:hypothetical protein